MATLEKVDLGILTKGGRIRNLSGKERGVAARAELGLDNLDKGGGPVEVIVPEYVDAISPSYFQGLFSQSLVTLHGKREFLAKYHFKASPQVMQWIEIGIRNATSSRAPLI
ncbi:hypothetical protein [Aminobacter aminovorans]|uniref:hypothetical protein n=1 Tax=Aminobacter aminovorans TaxID=83263 RepID=UPI0028645660|nr:hypothetical protein [Aminobacter aminovorans]MDR7221679.1 hypothetical protein [Aminobacter aminovorans]